MTFRLINPNIKGSFTTSFKGGNQNEVAENVWIKMSKYFDNSIPKFAFTLQNEDTNKLYHFLVKESLGDNDNVNYKIKEISLKNQDKISGGKRERYKDLFDNDENDENDSSSPGYKFETRYPVWFTSQPIYYWLYDPYIYQLPSIYIPTFISSVRPYIEIKTRYYL